MDIKNEHIEELKKHLESIQKIYDEKIENLENADTKEDAFKEGINAAMQALNIHSVSNSVCPKCGYPRFKRYHEDFERCNGCDWTSK